ncbi:head decoration protein [Streptomyces nigra]|uniref:K structural protein n=1 Tax=Streptomyces swartbergensis TaxID=487165 RepID=A0A243S4U7_9ACTN|nr:head decoration protein [Streptomyces swartbergensis]OUD02563.1 K structural protein [Streptomyces swartbergensis]
MNLTTTTETFGQDDQSWLKSAHGTDSAQPITLDTSAFVAGTHYPNGYFPSGLPLGRITATGLYGPYDGAASDGRETLAGFLFTAVSAPSVNTIDPQGALLWHGAVIEAKLPRPVDAAGKGDVAGFVKFF